MKSCHLAIVLAGASCLLTCPAYAQTPGGLSFQATLESIRVDARPAQVITRQFRLTLDRNQRETHFRARIEDWWRNEDGSQSFYAEPGKLRHSCGRWVSLNPVESSVKPGETLVIRLTISVPVEMASGGYWCALTVDEIPDPKDVPSGVGVRFVASVSTGIFVNVGRIERAARILDLGLRQNGVFVRVRNEGNTPLGIEGRFEFFAAGAQEPSATLMIPRTTVLTEPSPDGVLQVRLPAAPELPSGQYRVRAILDYGAPHYIGAEGELSVVRGVAQTGSSSR